MKPEEIADRWIDAWNSRDLERVLSLYDENAQMTSAGILKLGLNQHGVLVGKKALRDYWTRALKTLPGLHFKLLDVSASPDSVVVRYINDRGATICEYLRLNSDGKIVQSSANHLMSV